MEFSLQEILEPIAGASLLNTRYGISMQVESIGRFPRVAPYGHCGSGTERNTASEQPILVRL